MKQPDKSRISSISIPAELISSFSHLLAYLPLKQPVKMEHADLSTYIFENVRLTLELKESNWSKPWVGDLIGQVRKHFPLFK